jgi:hypothetical protein
MKTLNDIKQDMSELYEALKMGEVDIKIAGELANISGKFLKAEQLQLAKEIYLSNQKVQTVIEMDKK